MRHCGTVVHIRQGLPLIGRNLDTVLALVIVVIDINVVTDNGARTLVRTNTFIDIKCYANIFPIEFYIFTHLSVRVPFLLHTFCSRFTNLSLIPSLHCSQQSSTVPDTVHYSSIKSSAKSQSGTSHLCTKLRFGFNKNSAL